MSCSKYRVSDFHRISKIGEGTYGIVYKCYHSASKKLFALKKIRTDSAEEGVPSTAIREIAVLTEFNHPNVVSLEDTILEDCKIYLVFEFLKSDLKHYLDSLSPGKFLSSNEVKAFLYQILQGMLHLHRRRIIHRDLKPQNILISENGIAKIADFGLARTIGIPIRALTHEVVTLWYRAPEILLGTRRYSIVIDVWSVATIFSEMANNKPLFRGDSEIDQLFRIFKVLGTPNEKTWPNVSAMSEFQLDIPNWSESKLRETVAHLNCEKAIDLIEKMLNMDPAQRYSCQQALLHPYFDDFDRTRMPAHSEEYAEYNSWLEIMQGNLVASKKPAKLDHDLLNADCDPPMMPAPTIRFIEVDQENIPQPSPATTNCLSKLQDITIAGTQDDANMSIS